MSQNTFSKKTPLLELARFGQSIWLDYTRRDLIASGELRRLIEEDGLRGMTSNPSIFQKAIVGSQNYEEDIRAMTFEGQSPKAIYETLSQRDVQGAADEFRSVYDKMDARDGYVSLEVNPHLAHDTKGTIVEARRLWRALNRPNVFIKVPATAEGLPAIQQLISEGINVNITLLFGLSRYRQVAEAYIAGIEARANQGKAVEQVGSVASFFVSRIDSLVDPLREKLVGHVGKEADVARKVRGQVAIASATMAYQIYKEIFQSERFQKLADQGARVQRLLWASTSTKNPDYSDLKYVEALIGPDTINTVTVETLDAYRNHGEPKGRLEQDVEHADWVLQRLLELGINIDQMTQQLEDEGVDRFNQAFDKLMDALMQESRQPGETHSVMNTPILDRDLTKQAPHSPRERIAGFAIAGRTVDKCRASLAGTLGEYHYDCPLDNELFSFKGITGEQFKAAVQAAKTYEEIGSWLQANGTRRTPAEIKAWSDEMEADSPMNNPERRASFIENCNQLGLNPEKSTTFDWLEADDRASFQLASA